MVLAIEIIKTLLFAIDASLFGYEIPRNETFVSGRYMYHTPPIVLRIVQNFHAVAFHKTHIRLLACRVIVQCHHNSTF